MIQDYYILELLHSLHWNKIHKSIGVARNMGPYKLIRLPGHPILNLKLVQ